MAQRKRVAPPATCRARTPSTVEPHPQGIEPPPNTDTKYAVSGLSVHAQWLPCLLVPRPLSTLYTYIWLDLHRTRWEWPSRITRPASFSQMVTPLRCSFIEETPVFSLIGAADVRHGFGFISKLAKSSLVNRYWQEPFRQLLCSPAGEIVKAIKKQRKQVKQSFCIDRELDTIVEHHAHRRRRKVCAKRTSGTVLRRRE